MTIWSPNTPVACRSVSDVTRSPIVLGDVWKEGASPRGLSHYYGNSSVAQSFAHLASVPASPTSSPRVWSSLNNSRRLLSLLVCQNFPTSPRHVASYLAKSTFLEASQSKLISSTASQFQYEP